ncbi:MAG: sulfatase [Lawsonibacter sp.]|jgi:choline-sulfatase
MSKKRNILFLLADDYGAWAMGCAGNREVQTPNLDRLAQRGVRFENCFCVSPVCSPARASILTGKIPSQHGVHDWLAKGHLDSDTSLSAELAREFDDPNAPWYYAWPKNQLFGDHAIRYLDHHRTFTQVLAEHGYECALSGKWHLGDSSHPQAGYTFWRTTAMGGDNYYYPVVLEGGEMVLKKGEYITDVITQNALEFLNEREQEKPFFLSVHYTAPHSPWSEQNHPKEYIDLYRDCPFRSTPNVPPHPWAPNGKKTLAEWNREPHPGIRFSGAHYGPIPETWQEHRRESLTGYYAAITAMDTAIGRILKRLEADGLLENTLVIFSGDNGMSMGHHGIWGKGNGTIPVNMYDSAVKVPGIFCLPGVVQQGVVSKEMVSHYDFYQTILEMADIPVMASEDMPGISFAPLLTGEKERVRESVVVFDEYGPCRMIRTRTWKLVLRVPNGPNELYDLERDPGEKINRIGDPACAEVIRTLTAELGDWFQKYVDPAFDGTKEAVCGKGQLTSHAFQ